MAVHFDIDDFEVQQLSHQMGDYWMRVPDQIERLNRLLFLEWASARVVLGWVPAASEYTWKCTMSKWAWQDMKHAERLLGRKEELSGNRKITIPSQSLHSFIQDVAGAGGFFPFLAGWYLVFTKDMIRAYESTLEALDDIFDAPTKEIIEDILPKKRKHLQWAVSLIHDAVKEEEELRAITEWRSYATQYLAHLGGVEESPLFPVEKPVSPVAEAYGPAPKAVSNPAWIKQGNLEQPPEQFEGSLKIFMWHYATEIRAVDLTCYMFYGIDNMPFEFYVDLSRHIWDEARHHLMGVRRLEQLGYDLKDLPLPTIDQPPVDLEHRYSQLTMIAESCSFSRKKKSMDAFYKLGDILSGMTAEIDIIDERRHVGYGKKWLPEMYKRRFNENASIDEILREAITKTVESTPKGDFSNLSEEEKKKVAESISQFELCGRIEFKYLSYDRL